MGKIALVIAIAGAASEAAACTFCATELSQQVRLDVIANFWTNLAVAFLPFAVIGALIYAGYGLAAPASSRE